MKKVFTPAEVAEICHVTKPTVHNWIESGKIKSITLPNGYKKIESNELRRFLEDANIKIPDNLKYEYTVLIVDDEPEVLNTFKGLIEIIAEDKGIVNLVIHESSDGVDAALKIGTIKPDLILLDIMLPGMDGFEVCRKIRESRELDEVKIVIITGQYDPSMDEKVKEFKLEGILRKGVEPDFIQRYLGKYFK